MTERNLELSVTRYISASPEQVWQVMTRQLADWWCPKPWWVTVDAIEWRSGGPFNLTLHGPDGELVASQGVFLEVVPGERLVFTDAVNAQWEPLDPFMIGINEISDEGVGTRYVARARHWTAAARDQHLKMGFDTGWSAVADQLAALAELD